MFSELGDGDISEEQRSAKVCPVPAAGFMSPGNTTPELLFKESTGWSDAVTVVEERSFENECRWGAKVKVALRSASDRAKPK